MLVAAHVLEVLLLLFAPILLGRRWARARGWEPSLIWAGLLVFFVADALEIGAAKVIAWAFRSELLPMPGADSAPLVDAFIGGVVGAVLMESSRIYALRSMVERPSPAAGVLVGLGQGAGQAAVQGLTVLAMGVIAVVFEGKTFDEMQEIGIEGGAAVKIGLKIFAWWEGEPLDAVLAALRSLALLVLHVGLGALLAAGVRARRAIPAFLGAVVLHALVAGWIVWDRAASAEGLRELLPYGVSLVAGVGLAWIASGVAVSESDPVSDPLSESDPVSDSNSDPGAAT